MRFLPALLLLVPLATLAADAPRIIDEDGPAQGVQPLGLEELWRVGGEDDEVIFGRVADIACDGDGRIYVMDNQLCSVTVLSPDGEHVVDLGRQGDGPGEVRQAIGVVLMEDGMVGLGSGFPGRLVCLNGDGTPADTRFPIGEPAEGHIGVMINVQFLDGVLAATGGRLVFDPTGGPDSYADRFLAVCDAACLEPRRILERKTPLDPTGQRYVEKDDYYIEGRWTLAPGGLIYVAMERDVYEISVYDLEGRLQRVFGRRYEPRKRTQEDKDNVRPIINVAGRVQETIAEDHDECVRRLMLDRDNGDVWVLSPHGANDQPDGVLQTWDVFSAEGEYLRQVPVPRGEGIIDGTCYLAGGGRFVVVRGDGGLLGRNDDGEEDDAEIEVEPLEVICYAIR